MNGLDYQAILAREGTDLPAQHGLPQLPLTIQWMPPGVHTVTASQAGKPTTLTITVDQQTAETVEAARARYATAALAGTEDCPYFDHNHDDRAASAWPTRFYWAGADPILGGVRAVVNFSEAGKVAVLGRNYRRFSPCFYAVNGKVTGAPVNMGGLVNRAAFQRISPLISDPALSIAARSSVEYAPEETDFVVQARYLSASKGLEFTDACSAVARDNEAYQNYRASLGLYDRERTPNYGRNANAQPQTKPEEGAFELAAKVIAAERGIDAIEAASVLSGENPESYRNYQREITGHDYPPTRDEIAAKQKAEREDPEFVIAARIIAKANLTDEVEAASELAAANAAFYEAYRASLGLGKFGNGSVAAPSIEACRPHFIALAKAISGRGAMSLSDAAALVAKQYPEELRGYVKEVE